MTRCFPPREKDLKGNYLIVQTWVKILTNLVSKHCETATSRPHNSKNFQLIFTNEVSETKTQFILSNKVVCSLSNCHQSRAMLF